jgi:hypothetical protein
MTLTLKRLLRRPDGILSELRDEAGNLIAMTIEHSYNNQPKLYNGTFTCERGMHQLHSMNSPFETFEIMGVKGHDNILFHRGNWQSDSEGCVLLGETSEDSAKGLMVTSSAKTFTKFMNLLEGLQTFTLIVEG